MGLNRIALFRRRQKKEDRQNLDWKGLKRRIERARANYTFSKKKKDTRRSPAQLLDSRVKEEKGGTGRTSRHPKGEGQYGRAWGCQGTKNIQMVREIYGDSSRCF